MKLQERHRWSNREKEEREKINKVSLERIQNYQAW